MISKRANSLGRRAETKLEKAIQALVEQIGSLIGELAPRPQLQPVPVRVRTRAQRRQD